MSGKKHRLPNLDLYNFVEPAANDSPYVLTSPRSLQSCSKFGIKPMHLLPKTFDEFEDEYDGYDDVYIAFKKYEKDRLKRLHLCREEREKIIDRDNPLEISDDGFSYNDELKSDESFTDENISEGWKVLNPDEDGRESRREKYERPSILSYLESNQIATPRISSRRVTQSRGQIYDDDLVMDGQKSARKPAFNILSDSDESDDGESHINRQKSSRQEPRSARQTPRSSRQSQWLSRQTPRSSRQSPRSPRQTPRSPRQTPRSSRQTPRSSRQTPRSSRQTPMSSRQTPRSSRAKNDFPTSHPRSIPSPRYEGDEELTSVLSSRPLSSTCSMSSDFKKKNSSNYRSRNKNQTVDFSLEEIADELPKNVKASLSNMSVKDRKLLEALMNKASMEQEGFSKLKSFHSTGGSIREQEHLKASNREQKQQRRLREKQFRDQEKKRRQEENLRRIAEQNEEWINDLTYQDQLRKLDIKDKKLHGSQKNIRGNAFDQARYEHQKRSEHADVIHDLEEKQSRAALQFQCMMKQKEFKRTIKSAKERERKERQKEHLKVMEQDLESWQQELRDYQDISTKRAKEVVEKQNNKKSRKAHIKRLQKELDHLALKDRLDKEEEIRQQELQTLIQLKDERSKVISTEKEDYTNASREAARASRAVRDIIKEKTIQSSFDKMAANAEKISRIEKLGKNRPAHQSSLTIKHNSSIMLG